MTATLRVKDVHKGYVAASGEVEVLRGVDLDVQPGSLVAVLGPSGCGKTTLLRLIAGFDRPDAGTIELDGVTISGPAVHVNPERRHIGVVPQEGAVFPHLSVAGNVGFGLARGRRAPRVQQMLDLVGLGELADRMPHELSGGQLQRVALARALAPGPSLVLLDEPFAALDTALRATVRDQVAQAVRAVGTTAVLVTHDQEEALSMADEVAILQRGVIVQHDAPMSVYRRPATAEVAEFLGDSVLLDARADGEHVTSVLGTVRVRTAGEGTGQVLLRPEQLMILPRGGAGVPGTVVSTQYFGHDALVTVAVADARIRSRVLGAPVHLTPGTEVSVIVAGEAAYFEESPRDTREPTKMQG